MIGVIVPVHNEERLLVSCLNSLRMAAESPLLSGESVCIVAVLDACSDDSLNLARHLADHVIEVNARNVGMARGLGADYCLAMGCRWLAFTDADTQVEPQWLADQLVLESAAVCGTIGIRDWESYGKAMHEHFLRTYTDADGHRHIHGANLGLSAAAYQRAGGFSPLTCSEDVALVRALEDLGVKVAYSSRPRVWTSARKEYRAPGGFGETLARVQETLIAPVLRGPTLAG